MFSKNYYILDDTKYDYSVVYQIYIERKRIMNKKGDKKIKQERQYLEFT